LKEENLWHLLFKNHVMGWEENLRYPRKYVGGYWKTFKCNESANSLKLYKTDNLELSKPYPVNKSVFFLRP